MSQRTENQVAEMKKQTIGVEVEMNSITREKAARLAATFFGTGRYENTACRNGYCTWSAWDESGREWKFQKDVSIAGLDSEKCEMVTPILTYADMETLQELVRRLRKAGAKSDATRGCGVHIHIGAKGHTPQTLRNLANIMASHEDLLAIALNLDRGRISRYCRTVDPRFLERLNNRKPTTMAALADIWYGSQNADYGRSQHYNDSRYCRDASIYLADIMISEGAIPRKWTPAPNEIYTQEVKIDKRGIEVSNSASSQRTVITNTEFAGYYNDEVIFTLNKDETQTKKTTVDGELTVGKTKFVPMPTASEGLNIVILD